mmetsp:Transcript_19791/g.48095  ORF Transcript_19791/g.48095 Transcript_19791/m.48095 type:complete len:220 (-) Transcript_19791:1293-1952(-)
MESPMLNAPLAVRQSMMKTPAIIAAMQPYKPNMRTYRKTSKVAARGPWTSTPPSSKTRASERSPRASCCTDTGVEPVTACTTKTSNVCKAINTAIRIIAMWIQSGADPWPAVICSPRLRTTNIRMHTIGTNTTAFNAALLIRAPDEVVRDPTLAIVVIKLMVYTTKYKRSSATMHPSVLDGGGGSRSDFGSLSHKIAKKMATEQRNRRNMSPARNANAA